ncbi:acyltransferase [Agrobacterium rhizogenes]|nr:acyltransferase [Rhizobium rhizogenes]
MNLQVLRALAALSVVVAHAIHETENLATVTTRQAVDASAWYLGYGVDIFFVLSGFIMMHTAAAEFGKNGASLRFFLRRCARVVPLYWLLTSIMLLGAAVAPSLLNVPVGDFSHVVASYLFIPDMRGVNEVRPVLALGWTLNYEMLFYVLFALALMMPIRLGIVWLSVLMAALTLVGAMIEPRNVQIAFWTNPIILEFLFGVYVALIFRSGLRIGTGIALALMAVGLIGFARFSTPWDDAALPQFLRRGVPAAVFVLAAAIGPALPVKRIVLWGVALGDASYSLYLAHPFVVRPMRAMWAKAIDDHLSLGLFVIYATFGSIIFALALFRIVEKPLTAYVQELGCNPKRKTEKQFPGVRPSDVESR